MRQQELNIHFSAEKLLEQAEEERLRPIYQAQRDVLDGFCKWLNANHPYGPQFEVGPKALDLSIHKPYLDVVSDTLECKNESEELDIYGKDAYLILWELYQNSK